MAKAPGILNSKALTEALRKLASESVSVDDDGNPITRAQQLAELVWKFALGWTEETRDSSGTKKTVVHPPVAWAVQYAFERLEGKPAAATEAVEGRISAAEKVRQLAKDRINKLTAVASGPPKLTKPPKGDEC